jgi:hypothetical protein
VTPSTQQSQHVSTTCDTACCLSHVCLNGPGGIASNVVVKSSQVGVAWLWRCVRSKLSAADEGAHSCPGSRHRPVPHFQQSSSGMIKPSFTGFTTTQENACSHCCVCSSGPPALFCILLCRHAVVRFVCWFTHAAHFIMHMLSWTCSRYNVAFSGSFGVLPFGTSREVEEHCQGPHPSSPW